MPKPWSCCRPIPRVDDRLVTVVCTTCTLLLGVDAAYLAEVDGVGVLCPSCGMTLTIPGSGELDGNEHVKGVEKWE